MLAEYFKIYLLDISGSLGLWRICSTLYLATAIWLERQLGSRQIVNEKEKKLGSPCKMHVLANVISLSENLTNYSWNNIVQLKCKLKKYFIKYD